MRKFAFTCGDINGIGPEIVIKALNRIHRQYKSQSCFICPANVFKKTLDLIDPLFEYSIVNDIDETLKTEVQIIDIGHAGITPGKATRQSGSVAFKSIKYAFELTSRNKCNALITAPISKTAFKLAGIKFPGHTELLAEWSGSDNFIMTFLSPNINAALLTIHTPLKKVSGLITNDRLISALKTIISMLQTDLNISEPKIAVLGLNPHAGENGLIGDEEERIIKPVINRFRREAVVDGPFPPDAFFATSKYKVYDIVVGMYHDQLLIPFKMMNFTTGVNYTAGLKIIRTSPDHGVAYDIAWKNCADEKSLFSAYKYARQISLNRSRNEKDKS